MEAPRIIARADGIYYYNTQGERLLDGSSGLYCIPLGHGRREIREAVTKQMEELDYAPPFQYGVPAAFRLAAELAQILPTPAHFEQASSLVDIDTLTESVPCGPDIDEHIEAIREYEKAGFDELYISQMGPDQDAFLAAYRDHILPLFAGEVAHSH